MKRKIFLGRKVVGGKWRKLFSKTLVTEYLTGPSQYNHITLKWDRA